MALNEWWEVDLDKITEFDSGLDDMDWDSLKEEVVLLRNAIRAHRDQKGDDRCWIDDVELYKQLPENIEADFALPPKEEFLASCKRYCEKRQKQGS